METKTGNQELSPLPFRYARTDDPKKAFSSQWRISPVSFVGKSNEPRTDSEIAEMVKDERERKDWFIVEYWRKKGQPNEQIEFYVGGQPITIYNYNKNKPFTDSHTERMKKTFSELSSRFPKILDEIRWVIIEDAYHASRFGDPDTFPLNGRSAKDWHSFILEARGMELGPHRVKATSNFEGTLVHETTHLIVDNFQQEWLKISEWPYTFDYPDEFESRPTPDGTRKTLFNKKTGEMVPHPRFPLQPNQCVNYYARIHPDEDICESMVAYIYDPDLLQRISPEKFNILQKHDSHRPKPEVSTVRVPKDQIKLPAIKPETVYYFIKEPQS